MYEDVNIALLEANHGVSFERRINRDASSRAAVVSVSVRSSIDRSIDLVVEEVTAPPLRRAIAPILVARLVWRNLPTRPSAPARIRLRGRRFPPPREALLPARAVRIRPLDGLRLDLATVIGATAFGANARFEIESPLLDLATAASLALFISRAVFGCEHTCILVVVEYLSGYKFY